MQNADCKCTVRKRCGESADLDRIEMRCLVFVLCLYTLIAHPPLLRLYLQRCSIGEAV